MNLEELKFMDWGKCEVDFIRKVEADKDKIEFLLLRANKDLERAGGDKDASHVVEGYYETIKKILTAYLLKNGLRSKNHQCLISYLYKKFPDKEFECRLILQLSYLRNRLNYYGEEISDEFLEENKEDVEKLIKWLWVYFK